MIMAAKSVVWSTEYRQVLGQGCLPLSSTRSSPCSQQLALLALFTATGKRIWPIISLIRRFSYCFGQRGPDNQGSTVALKLSPLNPQTLRFYGGVPTVLSYLSWRWAAPSRRGSASTRDGTAPTWSWTPPTRGRSATTWCRLSPSTAPPGLSSTTTPPWGAF